MNTNQFRIPAIIIAVILAFVIFKHFDFNTFTFKEPWLDTLYIITLIGTLFIAFRKSKVKS